MHFLVFVHDVEPAHAAELAVLRGALTSRLGGRLHLAVIAEPATAQAEATRRVLDGWGPGAEVVAHGWSHRRPPSLDPFSWATGRADELAALSGDEVERRALASREALEGLLGVPVRGFVPPAFRWGALDAARLFRAGYTYGAGLFSLRSRRGLRPLGTFSWDAGRIACLGAALPCLGHLALHATRALPCLVFHPADVRRGFLRRGLQVLDALLARGRVPLRVAEASWAS